MERISIIIDIFNDTCLFSKCLYKIILQYYTSAPHKEEFIKNYKTGDDYRMTICNDIAYLYKQYGVLEKYYINPFDNVLPGCLSNHVIKYGNNVYVLDEYNNIIVYDEHCAILCHIDVLYGYDLINCFHITHDNMYFADNHHVFIININSHLLNTINLVDYNTRLVFSINIVGESICLNVSCFDDGINHYCIFLDFDGKFIKKIIDSSFNARLSVSIDNELYAVMYYSSNMSVFDHNLCCTKNISHKVAIRTILYDNNSLYVQYYTSDMNVYKITKCF